MKKICGLIGVSLMFVNTAYGVCGWGIVPPNRAYVPVHETKVFIHYRDGVQTMLFQPEFQGNADDFAIVYPTPSRPTVEEGPVNLFDQLDEATSPEYDIFTTFTSTIEVDENLNQTVTVIEEKQVGDFDMAILTATNVDDLVEWLSDHGYAHSESDSEKMEYYVEQGGFYFIVLKINMEEWKESWLAWSEDNSDITDEPEMADIPVPVWFGELSPLEISFQAERPQLPMRTLKSNMPSMTFDLYTVGEDPWYIPSADTVYANIVDEQFLKQVPDLATYDVRGNWVLRQEVRFSPSHTNRDVYLERGSRNMIRIDLDGNESLNSVVRFNPSKLDAETGIYSWGGARVVITGETGYQFNRSMTVGSRGTEVQELQKMLNRYGFTVSGSGPGSVGNESMYFGDKTKSALIRFQNFYRDDILTPVGLSSGTGYFGPSTIKFLNQ